VHFDESYSVVTWDLAHRLFGPEFDLESSPKAELLSEIPFNVLDAAQRLDPELGDTLRRSQAHLKLSTSWR
jgi:hypothetical protein